MKGLMLDNALLDSLMQEAAKCERRRMNFDLRTSKADGGQRMLNAMMPDTEVPVHRHPHSNENVHVLRGCLEEVLYNESGEEIERIRLCPAEGMFGYVVPAGVWHTVNVIMPTVIYEAKDGKYGEDGSESMSV